MLKKGISAIVATVLIILITIAAITILWMMIIPMVYDSLEFRNLEVSIMIVTSEGYTSYDSFRNIAMVQVRRRPDEMNIDRIKISFLIGGNTFSTNLIAPASGQTKVYTFDLSGYGESDSVNIVPIFVSSRGTEKEGDIAADIKMPKNSMSSVDGVVYGMEVDSFMEIPIDDLISIWTFSGDSADGWDYGDGVLEGNASIVNGSLNLDGDGDYANLSNKELYGFVNNNSFSFSVWTKISSLNYNNWNAVFGSSWDNVNQNSQPFLRFHKEKVNFGVWINATNHEVLSSRNWTTQDYNTWYHLVGVFNETHYLLYVNGTLDNLTLGSGPVALMDNPVYIGGQFDDVGIPQRFFNGSIDDLMVFNRSLSAEEVLGIYEAQYRD